MTNKKENGICDGGYGVTGNHSMYAYLNMLPDDVRREYENKLRKDNKESYTEYKEWEKLLKGE